MRWEILISDEYECWFNKLPQKHKIAIATDLEVLRNIGPILGRPYVDQIKGAKFSNLKELRTKGNFSKSGGKTPGSPIKTFGDDGRNSL